MNYSYFGGTLRTAIRPLFRTGRVRVIFAVALIGLGLIGSTGATLASYNPANAASSVVCQRNTALTLPAAISLTAKTDGLTYTNNGTSYYHVGGNNVAAIRAALNQCAPTLNGTGDYLAYTNYAVSWSYSVKTGENDVCTLSDVRVGLHVNQLLPSLLAKTSESTATQSKWNAFITGLHAHEDGHTAVDVAQATALLAHLQTLSTSCLSIASSAKAITTASTNAFVTANTEHDTDTDYGRDQGATF